MRFVVLEHGHPHGTHWDILFEIPCRQDLRTWSLPAWPIPRGWLDAVPKAPHRKLYLGYEGPISGSRGWVRRRDEGSCQILWDEEGEFRVVLRGKRRSGILEFVEFPGMLWKCRFQFALGA